MTGFSGLPISIALTCSIMAASGQSEQQPRQPVADTDAKLTDELRLVEWKIAEAIRRKDSKDIGRLVGSDFTFRESVAPSKSVPRSNWIRGVLVGSPSRSLQQRHQAARRLTDDVAVVSMSEIQEGRPTSSGVAEMFYLVDFWKRRGREWQLIARYSSPLNATSVRRDTENTEVADIDASLTESLRNLEEELREAALHGFEDTAAMDRLVATEFTQRVADAPERVLPREAWGQPSGRYKIESIAQRHYAARKVADDVAVMSLLLTQQASVAGRDRSGDFYVVDVWKRIDERWRLIARYSTPIGQMFDRSRIP
jgi:hypothetical protein